MIFKEFNKRGAMGEGIFMIYRLILVSFVAFIILGISSVFYGHYIDVRDAEAEIMMREVVNCVSPNGVLNFDAISDDNKKKILSYCGFESREMERFFVRVNVTDSLEKGKSVGVLYYGDSGRLWVKEAFAKLNLEGDEVGKYEPGYFSWEYPIYVIKEGNRIEASMVVEVLVSDEF